tara:strand:- start:183 stop:692 length:510 start_codon:yes stop_codon:yes gene_type:complete
MKYKVIDNFLPDKEFEKIVNIIMNPTFGWHFNECVTWSDPEADDNFYFTHTLYDWGSPQCPHFGDVFPVVEGCLSQKEDIDVRAIVRVKCNLYTRTEKILQHEMHEDYKYSHTACILGINDCDGFTIFEKGGKIESKANRMLIFDGQDQHCSTTCTNKKARININFNLL